MYIIAEVIWWLLLVFGCSVVVLGIALVLKSIPNQARKAKEDQADLVEMAKKFGTLVEDKYYETKKRYSYDEDGLKLIVNKISNKVPDEI
jgi:hypothetical protein